MSPSSLCFIGSKDLTLSGIKARADVPHPIYGISSQSRLLNVRLYLIIIAFNPQNRGKKTPVFPTFPLGDREKVRFPPKKYPLKTPPPEKVKKCSNPLKQPPSVSVIGEVLDTLFRPSMPSFSNGGVRGDTRFWAKPEKVYT